MFKYVRNVSFVFVFLALLAAVGCQSAHKARSTQGDIYSQSHEISYDDVTDRAVEASGSSNASYSFDDSGPAAHCPSCH